MPIIFRSSLSHRESSRRYYEKNKRDILAKERQKRHGEAPEIKAAKVARITQWAAANRDKVRGYKLKHQTKTIDVHRARGRAFMMRPENQLKARERAMRRLGITVAEYDALHEAQGGLCAICRNPETATKSKTGQLMRLAVDHDHETGFVRGLLCGRCNRGLGLFDDVTSRIQAALDYLKADRRDRPSIVFSEKEQLRVSR